MAARHKARCLHFAFISFFRPMLSRPMRSDSASFWLYKMCEVFFFFLGPFWWILFVYCWSPWRFVTDALGDSASWRCLNNRQNPYFMLWKHPFERSPFKYFAIHFGRTNCVLTKEAKMCPMTPGCCVVYGKYG